MPQHTERPLFPWYSLLLMIGSLYGIVLGALSIAYGEPRKQAVVFGILTIVLAVICLGGFIPYLSWLDRKDERSNNPTNQTP
ncbi:hypothetical protein KDA23_04015 [Candidatus Saccharibacteria bacterium]|nr:hypothetical protein [Candidatus Saccharibacteria bacterium]